MRNLENFLIKRYVNYQKLLNYGFKFEDDKYIYKCDIAEEQFEVVIVISNTEKYSKIIDKFDGSEYALVDVETATGEFVGNVRKEYEDIIDAIIQKCTAKETFRNNQTKEIINYVREKYSDELEFLWEKFDDNAIWRNKENNKWYGVILTIKENKLIGNSDNTIEILDLRYNKDEIENIIDNQKIFPGYHMNKKSWITVKLDNSIETDYIYELLDNSYNISIGNKVGLSSTELSNKVYEYLTMIPKGKVVTYKQVAEYLGNKGLARVVGNILHKNPDEKKYPCYKVLNSKGELAESFVFGGANVQKQKLENDGIQVINNKVDLSKYQWKE